MNRKGFATSFIILSLLALFLIILSILLLNINNSESLTSLLKNKLLNNIEKPEETLNTDELGSKIIREYSYTGSEQIFVAPEDGIYKLEVWGAQGGYASDSVNARGGYGGYSTGNIYLTKEQTLYINVGGKGEDATESSTLYNGGYNGGGNSYSASDTLWGSGGGATHIATVPGLLYTLSDNKSSVLIVAGGGGGGGQYSTTNNTGGSAGGYVGNRGASNYNSQFFGGYGGTQTSGGSSDGSNKEDGVFGLGGGSSTKYLSGAGAGYYGGGTGYDWGSSAGGGSSYISNTLTDAVMYCYNCTESSETSTKTISTTNVSNNPVSNYAKIGNGYAIITFIEN